MKRILINIILAAAAAAFVSCAQSESDDFNAIEQESLDLWISKNAPQAKPLGDSGMYYEVIAGEASDAKNKVDVKGRWVQLNYVMRNLDGDIAYSRSEKTARQLGTYNAYTHYIPDVMYIATKPEKSGIPRGIYDAITAITPGEMWKVYIPSKLAFSSTGYKITTGYGGQKGLEGNVSMILDSLQVMDIIDNPEISAYEAIDKLASTSKPQGWGLRKNDTIKKGVYLDIIRRLSERDTVPVNQTATIYYKMRFLDNKLINSNVDSVIYNNFGVIRDADKITELRITRLKDTQPYNADQVPAKAFYAILPELRYGDIGRVLVPSRYAYGRQYLRPDKTESAWDVTNSFVYEGFEYSDYNSVDTDYYFGQNTFYIPSNSSAVPAAEVKPYTPLIIEFTVRVTK